MNVTTNKRRCRCCYAQGTFKDLISSYLWLGESEVYGDILKECFNVHLINVADVESSGICDLCILTLRNANKFRNRVLQSEQLFKKYISEGKRTVKLESVVTDENDLDIAENADNAETGQDPETVKFECEISDDEAADNDESEQDSEPAKKSVKLESAVSDADYGEPDQDPVPDYIDNNFAEIDVPIKAEVNIETEVRKKKRKRKVKYDSDASEKSVTERGNASNNAVKIRDTTGTYNPLKEIEMHKHNMKTILNYSNATPINVVPGTNQFCCLYCYEEFTNPFVVKMHIIETHNNIKFNLFKNVRSLDYYRAKLDITDLKCTLCEKQTNTLTDFGEHVINEHDKKFFKVQNHILEFKFEENNEYICVYCPDKFVTFKLLLQHMNKHNRNYICKICDEGFISLPNLRSHSYIHLKGEYKCEICKKVFKTNRYLVQHEHRVHLREGLSKCPICNKRFTNHSQRTEHIVKIHGIAAPVYACNACDQTFDVKTKLSKHVRQFHLMERKYECTVCDMSFFGKSCLEGHLLKHSGEKNYKCEVCLKRFARKYTLNQHLRIHANDRKFKCTECSQSFIQKCSLKSHLRSRHGIES